MTRRSAASLTLLLSIAGCASFTPAACGGPDDPGAGVVLQMPDTIGGLRVKEEKKATKQLNEESTPDATYQCPGEGRVFTLRDGKELRGVLQVSRLAPDARLEDREFVSRLVRSITGNILQPERVGDVDVFRAVSAGNEQIVSTWFRDRFMFFLTVREDASIQGQPVDIDFQQVLTDAVSVEVVRTA